jgi:hypothetical protein
VLPCGKIKQFSVFMGMFFGANPAVRSKFWSHGIILLGLQGFCELASRGDTSLKF